MRCKKCNKDNREEANYCKWCGEKLVDKAQKQLQALVGMAEIKQQLRDILDTYDALMSRQRMSGQQVKRHNMLILGDSGMGKSTLLRVIQDLFYENKIISKSTPKVIDASEFAEFSKDFDNNVMAARDGILCIENVQKLLPDDEVRNVTDLDILFNGIKKWDGNPIVILMGTETGLGKFVQNNPTIASLFRYQFHLQPYTPEQIIEMTEAMLKNDYGLTLEPAAKDKLDRVYKQFYRDHPGVAMSAHIAKDKALEISEFAVRRDRNTLVATEADIQGVEYRRKTTEEAMAEFDKYVGVENIKDAVRQIVNKLELDALREGVNAKREITDHFLFLGNPGTGKTTMARLLADVLSSLEVLPIGQLVEVSRADLVGSYVGHTAPKVTDCVNKAMGGILFVDEAYSLKQGEGDSFGQEAIDTLLKLMEDRRGQFVVIAAGYNKEMADFIASNSGLESRFTKTIDFRDYTAEELAEIFRRMVKGKKLTLDEEAEQQVDNFFRKMFNSRTRNFANAREVRKAFENALKNQGDRIQEAKENGTFVDGMERVLTREDIEGAEAMADKTVDELLAELDELVGMEEVKEKIREIALKTQNDKRMAELGFAQAELTPVHIVLTGNPGTGKTTVARMLGRIFKAIGLLPTDKVVERERKSLVSSYVNESAKVMNKACEDAMGGILFIDEAYTLLPSSAGGGGSSDTTGSEAVDALMTRMENDRGKFVVVIAGYRKEIEQFLQDANPGFSSRFTDRMHIEDYTPEQLKQILVSMAKKKKKVFTPEADELLTMLIRQMYDKRDEKFGNAREMVKLYESIKRHQAKRISAIPTSEITQELCNTFEAADIPYEKPKQIDISECMKQLDELVGLDNVKNEVRGLARTIMVEQKRAKLMGRNFKMDLDHYLFLGNPGTGKTTVARIMADIFFSLGLLPTNKLIEVTRKDLVVGYIGQTAPQTAKVVKSALGGVLFIDEAYALSEGSKGDFGQEAINTLLPMLLDYKGKFICIAAGYTHEMKIWVESNSGLTSRFNKSITFEDYTGEQLADIFRRIAKKSGYVLTPEADKKMEQHFIDLFAKRDRHFGNAREVNNYFTNVKQRQGGRLEPKLINDTATQEELNTFEEEDM